MKIIISHDVDHLYPTDHIFKDLIIEKMWLRSFIHLCQGKINLKTFFYRLSILFRKKMNCIDEVMKFDKDNNIPSVFFFGMSNGLGMSYSQKKAFPIIKKVISSGFDAGVHGINFTDYERIKEEYSSFYNNSGLKEFGVRNHYVRFNTNTFEYMNKAGYLFDSTYFSKEQVELNSPYKVGNMWEFPLHIMDVYICKPGNLEQGLNDTYATIKQAERMGLPYCTILFHDYQFNDGFDPQMKKWYTDTIRYCKEQNYEFISYRDAINELENKK